MRSRRSSVVRALLLASMTLPLAALAACSGGFSAENTGNEADSSTDDGGSDGSDDGTVIVVTHDGGADAHDGTVGDAKVDVQNDGPSDASAGDGFTGCPTGDLTCAGQCVPNDTKNCGTCGHDCTNLPHVSGTVSCDTMTGACSFPLSSCAAGYTDCNGMPDDGCETPISTTQNCGGCNVACDAGAPVCQGSGSSYSCVTGCSGSTPTLCSGTCVNTTDNASNCGSCGHACPAVANAQPTCTNSTCGFSCNTSYTDCSGTCVNESSDPNNCGACGKLCPAVANAQTTCVSSACSFSCNGGFQKCGSGCITSVPDTLHGVFVAQGGGTTSSCGTEIAPCGTIAAALAVVSQSIGAKTILYLDDKSTFTEAVTLPAGVTLQGGWVDSAGTWTHECNPSTVATIQAPTSSNITVNASYSGSSTIDTVVIKSKATANAGESLYGVLATGSNTTLALQNVTISVAAAGAGANGGAVGSGMNGSTAGCQVQDTGAAGDAGAVGSPGASAYSSSGFTPAAATPGQPGDDGHYGTGYPANLPQCTNSGCLSCGWNSTDVLCEPCGNNSPGQVCGKYGFPGCPGFGGPGGNQGGNGGTSIGIFVYAAHVTITSSAIGTGSGGHGGAGSAGGAGGSGGPGVAGAAVCYQWNCPTVSGHCGTGTCTGYVDGGGPGGLGGNGGQGGQGGGGVGGDSYCVVYGGSANVSSSGWTCSPGAGGAAGNPNGPAGTSGNVKTF